MPQSRKRIDLRFGELAISAEGFENPVQPIKQVLRFLQRIVEETPEIAQAGVELEEDDVARMIAEAARRIGVPEDAIEARPGIVITLREGEAPSQAAAKTADGAAAGPAAGVAGLAAAAGEAVEPGAGPLSFLREQRADAVSDADTETEAEPVTDTLPEDFAAADKDDGHEPQEAVGTADTDTPQDIVADETSAERLFADDDVAPGAALDAFGDADTEADPDTEAETGSDPADDRDGMAPSPDAAIAGLVASVRARAEAASPPAEPEGADAPVEPGEPAQAMPELREVAEAEAETQTEDMTAVGVDGAQAATQPPAFEAPEPAEPLRGTILEPDEPEAAPANIFAAEDAAPAPQPRGPTARDEPAPEPVQGNIFADPTPEPEPEPAPSTANIFAGREAEPEPEPALGNIFADRAPDPAPANVFSAPEADTAPEPSPANIFGGEDQGDAQSGRRPRWIADPNEPAPIAAPGAPAAAASPGDANGSAPVLEAPEALAARVGAQSVPDILTVAAAWLTLIEKRPNFGRREVMEVFDRIPGDHPRTLEARIKGYGKLVRNGTLVLVDDGRFALSQEERSRFRDIIG